MKRTRARGKGTIKVLGRLGVVCIVLAFAVLVGAQYAHIIGRNVALAGELHAAESDVRSLELKKAAQQREIERLSDPHGAIPEIHDKLHLVGDGEAIIYLKKPHGT